MDDEIRKVYKEACVKANFAVLLLGKIVLLLNEFVLEKAADRLVVQHYTSFLTAMNNLVGFNHTMNYRRKQMTHLAEGSAEYLGKKAAQFLEATNSLVLQLGGVQGDLAFFAERYDDGKERGFGQLAKILESTEHALSKKYLPEALQLSQARWKLPSLRKREATSEAVGKGEDALGKALLRAREDNVMMSESEGSCEACEENGKSKGSKSKEGGCMECQLAHRRLLSAPGFYEELNEPQTSEKASEKEGEGEGGCMECQLAHRRLLGSYGEAKAHGSGEYFDTESGLYEVHCGGGPEIVIGGYRAREDYNDRKVWLDGLREDQECGLSGRPEYLERVFCPTMAKFLHCGTEQVIEKLHADLRLPAESYLTQLARESQLDYNLKRGSAERAAKRRGAMKEPATASIKEFFNAVRELRDTAALEELHRKWTEAGTQFAAPRAEEAVDQGAPDLSGTAFDVFFIARRAPNQMKAEYAPYLLELANDLLQRHRVLLPHLQAAEQRYDQAASMSAPKATDGEELWRHLVQGALLLALLEKRFPDHPALPTLRDQLQFLAQRYHLQPAALELYRDGLDKQKIKELYALVCS